LVVILSNPVYKGSAAYGRRESVIDESRAQVTMKNPDGLKTTCYQRFTTPERWITIPAPALVEEELWNDCQRRLLENKTTHGGGTERKYLLSGLLRCPFCGGYVG